MFIWDLWLLVHMLKRYICFTKQNNDRPSNKYRYKNTDPKKLCGVPLRIWPHQHMMKFTKRNTAVHTGFVCITKKCQHTVHYSNKWLWSNEYCYTLLTIFYTMLFSHTHTHTHTHFIHTIITQPIHIWIWISPPRCHCPHRCCCHRVCSWTGATLRRGSAAAPAGQWVGRPAWRWPRSRLAGWGCGAAWSAGWCATPTAAPSCPPAARSAQGSGRGTTPPRAALALGRGDAKEKKKSLVSNYFKG